MHPSPAYARLQVASRIRAELVQRLRGLSVLVSSGSLAPEVNHSFARVVCRLERAARDIDDFYLFNEGPTSTNRRSLERQMRTELEWLITPIEQLCDAAATQTLTASLCDRLLAQITSAASHTQSIPFQSA